MSKGWTNDEIQSLIDNYPSKGRMWCCEFLNKTEPQIRAKASRLGLRQDRNSEFFLDWQKRAAESKIGKKRPDQAEVMRNLHKEGKMIRSDELNKVIAQKRSESFKINGHPRGMLGKNHSEESKKKIGDSTKKLWEEMSDEDKLKRVKKSSLTKSQNNSTSTSKRYSASWKCGWRIINSSSYFFRSSWEANYARFLELLKDNGDISLWEYEPISFVFEDESCIRHSYLPDFRVTNNDNSIEYHEVKGWFDDRAVTIFEQMSKFYPDIKLVVIDSKYYKKLNRLFKDKEVISEWE